MPRKSVSGIYKIVNQVNGKVYVGSTTCFGRRRCTHFNALKNGNHHSSKLQASFIKHGISAFEFVVIERLDDEHNILEREQHWIDHYDAANRGYNMRQLAGRLSDDDKLAGSERMKALWKTSKHKLRMASVHKGKVVTEETRKRMSEAAKRRFEDPDERLRVGALRLGIPLTAEAKIKMSATSTGQKRSEEFKSRMSEFAKERMKDPVYKQRFLESRLGKGVTEETRQKMKLAAKKRMENPETRAKISEANKGRVMIPSVREKISNTLKASGYVASPETCEKIRASKTGKKRTPEHIANMREGMRLARERKKQIAIQYKQLEFIYA